MSVVDFDQSLPVTIHCADAEARPFYELTPDDIEEQPEVSQYSLPFQHAIKLRPESAAGLESGEEGTGAKEGVTVVHAVCYSPSLRMSSKVSAS